MINAITLTSSMRSNLASLKTIATQMSKTQQTLSTGKKVNSAIDNASSYYQARSLTNRANDLNSLLDSMGQGIQTIQAATQGLDNAISFIEQATAVANQAYEVAEIPEKEWFIDKVGENGAVVSTAQELKDAITSGKETICVYGKIDYFDGEEISLKDGQKLVGVGYFGDFDSDVNKFSSISGKGVNGDSFINCVRTSNTISDLSITFEGKVFNSKLIEAYDNANVVINNLDLGLVCNVQDQGFRGALCINGAKAEIRGVNNITSEGSGSGNFSCWFLENSDINVYGSLNTSSSIFFNEVSQINFNVYETATIKAESFSLRSNIGPNLNIKSGAEITFLSSEKTYKVNEDFEEVMTSSLTTSNIKDILSVVETEQKELINKLDYVNDVTKFQQK